MSPNIEVVDINEVSKSMSFIESNLRFRKRRTKKKPLGQAMSSLDSARFKSTAESDGIKVEKDEQPIEPAISIFDLIENEKSKTGIEKIDYPYDSYDMSHMIRLKRCQAYDMAHTIGILITEKGDTAWRNALKSQPLLPVADLDSKMEHLNSRFEVLFKSLAKLRSEGNFEELYL